MVFHMGGCPNIHHNEIIDVTATLLTDVCFNVEPYLQPLTLYQPMTYICVMSVLLFFHKSIRIYMEVIMLGANTLYSDFCLFKALLPK